MSERKYELDVIRIIACFFVVVIHVAGYGMESTNPMTANWIIRNIITCLTRCAVPIFFMLSGILFMEKDISIKQLYKKYIFRIIIIWIIWSSFYAVIDYIAYWKKGGNSIAYFAFRFFTGHYHLWFLPALLIVYIFLPILQNIVKYCPTVKMKYLGGIIMVGVILKETIDPFLDSPSWDSIWNNIAIPGASIGIIYFVIGYYLYKNYDMFSKRLCVIIYLVSCMVMAGINMICAFIIKEHTAVAGSFLGLWILSSAVFLFCFLMQSIPDHQMEKKLAVFVKNVSECTFGIYLIHTFFIEQVYRRLGITQDRFPTIISIMLFSIGTFLISFIFAWCIRKIPVIGKWLA